LIPWPSCALRMPPLIRSDNGPEVVSRAIKR
jgi:hypothetical protein